MMKVLFATSEAFPFAVSGGLGDVSYALPKALRKKLLGVRVIMPLYSKIPQHLREKMSGPTGKSDFIKTVWGVGYKVSIAVFLKLNTTA